MFQGIHNIFVVLPQFLSISMSAAIFSILDPGRSILGGTSTQLVGSKKIDSLTIILRLARYLGSEQPFLMYI